MILQHAVAFFKKLSLGNVNILEYNKQ